MDPESQRSYAELPSGEEAEEIHSNPTAVAENSRNRRIDLVLTLVGICCVAAGTFFWISLPSSNTENFLRIAPEGGFLASERTAFHFQPRNNWMNDPNGPLFHKGYYHLFYQYNPYGVEWGNISWGHAVSTDLLHWQHMDLAMQPDKWYDADGVWSGSATILPNGQVIMLYTGSTNASVQVQNLALPLNTSDPLLREWIKIPENPILVPPPGIAPKDFRDPTTAWLEADGLWRIAIGAKKGRAGLALIYKTFDFLHWELEEEYLHTVQGTGMWECIDFYPVSTATSNGLDTSKVQTNELTKHILKASLDDDKHDYYAIGLYSESSHTWIPDALDNDVGLGLRYDYGKYYASKTFFDSKHQKRILWGWANESDSLQDDIRKGWSSVQTLPRILYLDNLTGTNLIQWPIEEVEALRHDKVSRSNVLLKGGDVVEVDAAQGAQLDIEVGFEYPDASKLDALPESEIYDCSQGGATHRGVYGPFGLLVLAEDKLQEMTAVYFYMTLKRDGSWETRVCSDQSRSSLEPGIDTTVYGTLFHRLPTEDSLSLRVIVDHSIVETFVQGGRACITSRVYPTLATGDKARLFMFNNGTQPVFVKNLDAWKMRSTTLSVLPVTEWRLAARQS
ncbi:acid beta-fructofuranosidase [Selaginella moellendorffii]|uniref:acid beta-fructofuranosidase n=1 Tax=Selaginella moellendorffii TaxID=88036 RepID=UPI000D1CFAC3|nr:acid beta-fructofuranosidase [Selaginella moellendorffii]|eukprot:XP_024537264.1 acid beta-fructofuranosidase [Selaginella moellendorffii]